MSQYENNGGVPWDLNVMALKMRVILLAPLAMDTSVQLHILSHDGQTLGVDSAKVGVLKETHQVSLTVLLKSQYC